MLRTKTSSLAPLVASLLVALAGCADDGPGGQNIFLLSDAEIMKVLHVVNDGEIKQGELAQMKATAQSVKDLAGRITTAHKMTEERQLKIDMDYVITPQETQTSKDVAAKAMATLASLQAKSGADFDRAYVDAQVTMHTETLDLIDTKLYPLARISVVRSEVPKARAEVDGHLTDAKMVQSQLAGGM